MRKERLNPDADEVRTEQQDTSTSEFCSTQMIYMYYYHEVNITSAGISVYYTCYYSYTH